MKILLIVILVFLLHGSYLLSRTFYIDSESGNDSNRGSSSDKPWKSFSNVRNTPLSPGDSVLLKKGGRWNDMLLISCKGERINPIVFSSYSKGELPVIDINGKSISGVTIKDSRNVILDGYNILNPGVNNCNIKVIDSENCIVRNCEIFNTGRAGIFIERSSGCTIQANNISTPSEFIMDQADGIYGQRNRGNIYAGNTIVDRNLTSEEHSDCIQLFNETGATIKNNYLEQDNKKTANAQGIYSTVPFGNHYYYNNVIFAPNTKAQLLGFFNFAEGRGRLFAFNNTIEGGFMNCFRTDDARPVVKNNIFITRGNYSMVRFELPLLKSAEINNNIYFTSYPKPVFYITNELSFSDWKKQGWESEGLNGNPLLTKDYKLKPGSPCINSGADLSLIFNEDKSGATRTKKKRFDLGAYQFTN